MLRHSDVAYVIDALCRNFSDPKSGLSESSPKNYMFMYIVSDQLEILKYYGPT